MQEKTASWTWQRLDAERSETVISPETLARIRRLAVYWETAENGAAGLADEDFLDLDNASEAELEAAVDVFLNTAVLPTASGVIRNPYAQADAEQKILLEDVPDKEVAGLFLSGADIPFVATDEDLTLWREANLGSAGINPKRPFGSESVSRDLRAILDPEKTLSNAAFAKRRRQAEARMLLMLQLFVQTAEMEPGTYRRGEDWQWKIVSPDDPPSGEMLTRAGWCERMSSQMAHECKDYVETLRALNHLVWNGRLKGSYTALATQFQLGNHFGSDMRRSYIGTVEERLKAAFEHFPEKRSTTEGPWLTLSYVRILNADARFSEAREVLEKADLFDVAPKEVDLSTINAPGIALLEGLIARRGGEWLDEDEFQSILANSHSGWWMSPNIWSFVWDVQRHIDNYRQQPMFPSLWHAQAAAAQIELMRGGYDPDYEIRHY